MNKPNKKVAAIITEYWSTNHADVIITKFLDGYTLNGRTYKPTVDIVSMFIDQFPANDMGKDMADKHGVSLYPSIREALLHGGDTFELDGIIVIGELGEYPENEIGQVLYPRRAFFEECLNVMLEFDRIVPVFTDKGFAIVQEDIEWMYEQIKKHDVPFMSSSVLPFCPQLPRPAAASIPYGAPMHKMLGFAYDDVERYCYHTMEMMQSVAENRAGGETGIRAVRTFTEQAAIDRILSDDWHAIYRKLGGFVNLRDLDMFPYQLKKPVFVELEYADGLQAGMIFAEPEGRMFVSAYQVAEGEEPVCVEFRLQNQKPHSHFSYLVLAIERFIHTRNAPYPVERSLLTTGALDALMHSLYEGKEIQTPHLSVSY
ncbi:hypothetical protein [Paenibacillus nasutitermitis]|uniref:Uncharacterized protein n=1 Tax=Paenibacillus nasutitermitis TaxID=1652958 RepID=A0A916Z4Z4_9BACL|nr:hypothetical protein [Paenibacillus nasutitermitis]GGD76950.1 hypothetical protein GCM10010911_38830 [Paenibacillus nasutitermitis]